MRVRTCRGSFTPMRRVWPARLLSHRWRLRVRHGHPAPVLINLQRPTQYLNSARTTHQRPRRTPRATLKTHAAPDERGYGRHALLGNTNSSVAASGELSSPTRPRLLPATICFRSGRKSRCLRHTLHSQPGLRGSGSGRQLLSSCSRHHACRHALSRAPPPKGAGAPRTPDGSSKRCPPDHKSIRTVSWRLDSHSLA